MSVWLLCPTSAERKCIISLHLQVSTNKHYNRYKPAVKLRFVTEELGFESDEESARFLCDHGAQAFLEEGEDIVRLLTGKVGNTFEAAKLAAFRRVDIKGQI